MGVLERKVLRGEGGVDWAVEKLSGHLTVYIMRNKGEGSRFGYST